MTEHECNNGWADQDATRPCRVCRPWHFACTVCGATVTACYRAGGRCCPSCPHTPPRLGKRKGATS